LNCLLNVYLVFKLALIFLRGVLEYFVKKAPLKTIRPRAGKGSKTGAKFIEYFILNILNLDFRGCLEGGQKFCLFLRHKTFFFLSLKTAQKSYFDFLTAYGMKKLHPSC